jgi:hypothetical protein
MTFSRNGLNLRSSTSEGKMIGFYDVELEDLSQQFSEVLSPSKPPAPKKAKKDGDGSSKDRALELSESQE